MKQKLQRKPAPKKIVDTMFIRSRLSDLHPFVFNPDYCQKFDAQTIAVSRLAYRAWNQRLLSLGMGTDYCDNPNLKLPILLNP